MYTVESAFWIAQKCIFRHNAQHLKFWMMLNFAHWCAKLSLYAEFKRQVFYHEKALSSWAFGPFQVALDTGCTEVIYQPGHGHLSRSLKQHNPLSRATEISWMTTIFPNPIRPVFINRPVIIWKPVDTRLSITDPNRGWIWHPNAASTCCAHAQKINFFLPRCQK